MAAREILGHIDCPTCGTAKGVRITLDKNGEPFGYCEAKCHQQLRIGGDAYRVGLFLERFPWASGRPAAAPAPVSAPVPAPEPAPAAKPAAKPVTAPAPAPAPARPRSSNPFDFLLNQGKA